MAIAGAGELAWWVKHHVNVRIRVQIPRTHVKLDAVVSIYNPSVRIRGGDGRILGSSVRPAAWRAQWETRDCLFLVEDRD